jgi:CRISPR-associated protein (TIGR03984 family)
MKPILQNTNGLTLLALASQVIHKGEVTSPQLSSVDDLIKTLFAAEPELAVFYFDYGIRFAAWQNHRLNFYHHEPFDPNYLQEARIFSAERELRIWRQGAAFGYRLRVDKAGDEVYAVEANQNLWGTHADSLEPGWTRLWEDRGVEIKVPVEIHEKKNYSGPLAYLRTRNYIGFMANGQATYVDCRFVGIERR